MSKTRPKVCMIVAADTNDVIGVKNAGMPWHFPEDLKYFREVTMGHPVVMGRLTFESMGRFPLKGRKNYVLSNTMTSTDEVTVLTEAVIPETDTGTVFIIGGSEVFKLYENAIDCIFLTRIHKDAMINIPKEVPTVKLPFTIGVPNWVFSESCELTTKDGTLLSFELWKRGNMSNEYIYTV